MSRRPCLIAAVLAVAIYLLAASPPAQADEIGLNVFGFSHHFKNPFDDDLKEFNPGLGVQWTFARSARASLECDAGVYEDSFAHANTHLSLGGRVRAVGPLEFGLHLVNAVSPSLDDNHPVVIPYPFVAVRTPRATINMTYMPELKSFNGLPAMATFVTVYPWGDRAARRARDLSGEGSTRSAALEFEVEQFAALAGFGEIGTGFMWRNMFNDRHGLRLGTRLGAAVQSLHAGETTIGPSGSFAAELLAQYLWRQAPHGPLRTYWATGLQTGFHGGTSIDESTVAWRTDFGMEYALTPAVALLIETGVELQYHWEGYESSYEAPRSRESWAIGGTGAQMKLVTTWGRTGDAGTTADTAALPAGPVVLLTSALRTTTINGNTFGWRWSSSPERSRRLSASPYVGLNRDEYREYNQYVLTARLEFIRRTPGVRGLSSYWGMGPLLTYRYSENLYRGDYRASNEHTNGLAVGGTAVVGVDYALARHVLLMAEYSADLTAEWSWHSWRGYTSIWRIGNNDVRLGLGTAF